MNRKEYFRQYYLKNKDKILEKNYNYFKENPEYAKEYRLKNKDKYNKSMEKFYSKQENLDKRRKDNREYHKKKRKEDPLFRLKHNMRRRLTSILKANGLRKTISCMNHVGCSLNELKLYLENKFQQGMTWDNYGKWHIDHIKPLKLASDEVELKKLFHYTNLQPLWAEDNHKKQGKYEKN